MSILTLKAYSKLIHFDLYLARRNFSALYEKVRKYPARKQVPYPKTVEEICSAVDMACIWYWKEALCLQRSAATACLLKDFGVAAQMVIGAQQMPFKAHAWVEVDGRVVNDKAYTPEMYAVLDRC
jgi:Transglutaminase-like superfamily